MNLPDSIKYVGVNDNQIDLFESQYPVPNGISYNSYLILDKKVALLDSVDGRFCDLWLSNVEEALDGRSVDYLVVHHMEPDHSACVSAFLNQYREAKVVLSKKALTMLEAYFGEIYQNRSIIIEENDMLELGEYKLKFFAAPMVHWPEVMVSYEESTQTLFSADAFGTFSTPESNLDWESEARRYYFGIVGKYGLQVQSLLKKLTSLQIKRICSLHGPILSTNLEHYLGLYNRWSSYLPSESGVLIAYSSIYGHTKEAVECLVNLLSQNGVKALSYDLARTNFSYVVSEAFHYDRLVLASPTYNGGLFPPVREFILHLRERNFQKRRVGLIENGSWASVAAKLMREALAEFKEITICETKVQINASLSEESRKALAQLASEIGKA